MLLAGIATILIISIIAIVSIDEREFSYKKEYGCYKRSLYNCSKCKQRCRYKIIEKYIEKLEKEQ